MLKILLDDLNNIAELARRRGICDETAYRNRIIKLEFEQMKIDFTGETCETFIQRLAEKKWNGIILSYAQVEKICFPRGEEKEKVELAIQLATENDECRTQNSEFRIDTKIKKHRRTYARRK